MERLTLRQKRVMEFLREHVNARGYPPTMREMGEALGFSWPAARGHLRALERKGLIRINPRKSRGVEITGMAPGNTLPLPLVGDIRAGRPLLAREEIGQTVAVDRNLFRDEDAFVLRVTGDSMRDAGILEGDYVVVSPSREVSPGSIGVALIGEEATVKRIYPDREAVTLVPANSAMAPESHDPREVTILGRVTGVIRKL